MGEQAYQPLRPVRFEFIDIRGLRHRVALWGPESATPIVLLHGFMDCSLTFQFLVDQLPADWSFAAPDWRGFGGTESTGTSYWFPDYLADLEVLLDRLTSAAPACVIGHSMGGNIASLYAGIRPDRLRWLVNLEGFGLRSLTAAAAPARYGEWLDQLRSKRTERHFVSPQQLATVLARRNPRLTLARAQFIAEAWTRPVAGGYELATDPMHRLLNPVIYRRDEAEACWQRMTCPMLLLLGEQSEYLPHLGADGTAARFRQIYQRLTLTTLPGVGHMLHHEDPAAVAATIVHFQSEQA